MSYLSKAPTRRQTPQSEPIPGSDQVANSAGGFAWKVDPLTRLRRFLVLGAEGGTYYISERKLVSDNVSALHEADPFEAIKLIAEVSIEGRAPKQDPTLFALAFYSGHPDLDVRRAALRAVPAVCRTGTMLFRFCEFAERQRGWGRSLRRAIAAWYGEGREPRELAYQLVKYRQREGWSHRDLLRLSHPQAPTSRHEALYEWAVRGTPLPEGAAMRDGTPSDLAIVEGFVKAQESGSPRDTARLVRDYGLTHEMVKPEHKTSVEVWQALFEKMPLGALVRQLPTLTRVGVIRPLSQALQETCARLVDSDALRAARIHPIKLLAAQLTYASGHSARGSSEWSPVSQLVDALDAAFYLSFGTVDPAGKRFVLAIDTSASMTWNTVAGVPGLTPQVAAAAMALVTAATEPEYHIMAFSTGVQEVDVSPKDRLGVAQSKINALYHGGTDCSAPMTWAYAHDIGVDCFVVLTDNETWFGNIHPAQAIEAYRRHSDIAGAALVVEAMEANEFSIADPNDRRMLDVCGFDTGTPQLISEFAAGKI